VLVLKAPRAVPHRPPSCRVWHDRTACQVLFDPWLWILSPHPPPSSEVGPFGPHIPRPMASGRQPRRAQARGAMDDRDVTLVWIDSREATIVRRDASGVHCSNVRSDVPPHHRSTGHVRHNPATRHGGGGVPQDADEPRRHEHIERFLEVVAALLPADDDLVLVGPGTIREHLARRLAREDDRRRAARRLTSEAAAPMTDRQLAARLRTLLGEEPRRRGQRARPPWASVEDHKRRPGGRQRERLATMVAEEI